VRHDFAGSHREVRAKKTRKGAARAHDIRKERRSRRKEGSHRSLRKTDALEYARHHQRVQQKKVAREAALALKKECWKRERALIVGSRHIRKTREEPQKNRNHAGRELLENGQVRREKSRKKAISAVGCPRPSCGNERARLEAGPEKLGGKDPENASVNFLKHSTISIVGRLCPEERSSVFILEKKVFNRGRIKKFLLPAGEGITQKEKPRLLSWEKGRG